MKIDDQESNIVFGLTPAPKKGDAATVLVGIPFAAWRKIRKGVKVETVDLALGDLKFKIIVFAAENHRKAAASIQTYNATHGQLSGDGNVLAKVAPSTEQKQ